MGARNFIAIFFFIHRNLYILPFRFSCTRKKCFGRWTFKWSTHNECDDQISYKLHLFLIETIRRTNRLNHISDILYKNWLSHSWCMPRSNVRWLSIFVVFFFYSAHLPIPTITLFLSLHSFVMFVLELANLSSVYFLCSEWEKNGNGMNVC